MDPIQKIIKTVDANLDRAWSKYVVNKKGKELQEGMHKFITLDIGPFIKQLCQKYDVDEQEFYDALLDSL